MAHGGTPGAPTHAASNEAGLSDAAKIAIIKHMNQDHEDQLKLFCQHLSSDPSNRSRVFKSAKMVSMDTTGFDVSATHEDGGHEKHATLHFTFPREIKFRKDARELMVEITAEAEKREKEFKHKL